MHAFCRLLGLQILKENIMDKCNTIKLQDNPPPPPPPPPNSNVVFMMEKLLLLSRIFCI